jgi:hypothetical protein
MIEKPEVSENFKRQHDCTVANVTDEERLLRIADYVLQQQNKDTLGIDSKLNGRHGLKFHENLPNNRRKNLLKRKRRINGNCWNCGVRGHVALNCIKPQRERNFDLESKWKFDRVHAVLVKADVRQKKKIAGICWNCEAPGHMETECTELRKKRDFGGQKTNIGELKAIVT